MTNKIDTASARKEEYIVPVANISILLTNDVITASDPYLEDILWDL